MALARQRLETPPPSPPVTVRAAHLHGLEASLFEAEIAHTPAPLALRLTGVPPTAAREILTRITSALKQLGEPAPSSGLTITLRPPDFLYRETPGLELALALGVLAATHRLRRDACARTLALGELQLTGAVRSVRGVLPIAEAARAAGFTEFLVPRANAAEARLVAGLTIVPINHLREALDHLSGRARLEPFASESPRSDAAEPLYDMADLPGLDSAKAVLELAAAGGHPTALLGPAGGGATQLARRLCTVLPPLTEAACLELTRIYSVTGLLPEASALVRNHPFRAPHHTISEAGLLGGGTLARPGEATLAHHGVLYLDEAQELRERNLDTLFHWLERGSIELARAGQRLSFPCHPVLLASVSSCPCGYAPSSGRCTCRADSLAQHQRRLSRLLARFDLIATTERPATLTPHASSRPSEWYRSRVTLARQRQTERFAQHPGIDCNARIPMALASTFCVLTDAARTCLDSALHHRRLTDAARHRLLFVARTRADLEGHVRIEPADVLTALGHFPAMHETP